MTRTSHARKPKGIIPVTDRQRAAVRQLNEGTATRAELMALYGCSRQTLRQWSKLVREAADDAATMIRLTLLPAASVLLACCFAPNSSDRGDCEMACNPNAPSRFARSAGKFSCECDVRSGAGIVRKGSADTSHYYALCGGRAIRSISVTVFGESAECAP